MGAEDFEPVMYANGHVQKITFIFNYDMKRTFSAISASLLISMGVAAPAHAETLAISCGSSATYTIYLPAGVASSGNQCSGNLTIDSRVKIIEGGAFKGSALTSVTLPDSVSTIGYSAFFGSKNLKTLNLGKNVSKIQIGFIGQTAITTLVLPDAMTVIDNEAFKWSFVSSVTLPKNLQRIGDVAFANLPLTSITLPSTLKSIGIAAFAGTKITTLVIPSSLTEISSEAFGGSSLTSVKFPNTLTVIPDGAFSGTQLTSLDLPKSLKSIGASAFAGIAPLKTVVIPDSVKEIGEMAFAGAKSLTTVTLPIGLNKLGANAFTNNYSLTTINYCGNLTGLPIEPICKSSGGTSPAPAASKNPLKPGKSTTSIIIKCIKGSKTLTVMGKNPNCPAGYTKK